MSGETRRLVLWLLALVPVMFAAGVLAAVVGWPNPYIAMSLAGGGWALFATYKEARRA